MRAAEVEAFAADVVAITEWGSAFGDGDDLSRDGVGAWCEHRKAFGN